MFTGIIEELGFVRSIAMRGENARIVIGASVVIRGTNHGDSISVNGVCLTALDIQDDSFAADVSRETLSCTTLGALDVGAGVNLEKSLRLADRLGGHLVSGHVDGVGRVLAVTPDARSQCWTFELPPALARYVAQKGSICIDGVSLTVNDVDGNRFGVNLIPHTVAVTTFAARGVGAAVNIEVDLIARYVERLYSGDRS